MNLTNFIIQTVFWAFGFLFLYRIPRCRTSYREIESYPSVSVIIPARNEERSLPVLIASLRNQSYIAEEIIVVVDQSDDRTRETAEREGVRVIEGKPLPRGWLGKPWACYQGAQVAKGDILIFLDADTQVEKGGLEEIIKTYLEKDGIISIQPYHKTKKLYEQLSAFFNIILMAAMGVFTVMGKMRKPIGLFGPCIVMRKKYYYESGGHKEVKSEVVEDLALGEILMRQRLPIYCYGGKGTISFRMYPNGIRELIDGWSKGFATGAVKTFIPLLLAIITWIGGGISATRYAIEAITTSNTTAIIIWASAYLAYSLQIYWMLFRIGTFKFYTALFYPIPLLFFLIIFLRSVFQIFIMRTVRWKGVKISLKDKAQLK